MTPGGGHSGLEMPELCRLFLKGWVFLTMMAVAVAAIDGGRKDSSSGGAEPVAPKRRVSPRAYSQLKRFSTVDSATASRVQNSDLIRAVERTRAKLIMRDSDIIIVSFPKSSFHSFLTSGRPRAGTESLQACCGCYHSLDKQITALLLKQFRRWNALACVGDSLNGVRELEQCRTSF